MLIADFSHDGTADALVGAYGAAGGGTLRGRVYWFDDSFVDQIVDGTLTGEQNFERFGWSLAAGKFSSDLHTLLLVGAYLWDDGSEPDSGRIVVATVPEPAAYMIASMALLVAGLRRVVARIPRTRAVPPPTVPVAPRRKH